MQVDMAQPGELTMRRMASPLAAWAISFGCTIGWGAFVMPGTTFLPKAGPLGTAIAFVFGSIAMLVVAINYGYMARRCKGDGGVYSYAHETFGPNQAFICSWCLVLAYGASLVANSTALALVLRNIVGPLLQVGPHYAIAGYEVYMGEALSGVLATVLAGYVCMRSSRLNAIIETVLALGMAAGTLAIIAIALRDGRVNVASVTPLFSPSSSPLAGTMAVVASVPWAYIGFETVTQMSGECAFDRSKFSRIMIAAIACGTVMYLVINTVAAAFAPQGYSGWVDYVADLDNLKRQGIVELPTFYAGYQMAGRLGVLVFGVTALCSVLTGVIGFYVVNTRLIYAMALDGALPKRFARLHASYRTPVVATLAVLLGTFALPFLGRNVLNWVIDLMSLGALIAYTYTSMGVVRHARAEENRLMSVMGMLGVALSMVCIALLIVPIPGLDTSLSRESYVILLAWVALGVNFFTPTIMRS